MSDVILINRTRRPPKMRVYNLSKNIAAVKVENRVTVETRDGKRAKKLTSKLVPTSIRIPAKGQLIVPEIYLSCPEIAAAIKNRELLVKKIVPSKPLTTSRAASSEGESSRPKPRKKKA